MLEFKHLKPLLGILELLCDGNPMTMAMMGVTLNNDAVYVR